MISAWYLNTYETADFRRRVDLKHVTSEAAGCALLDRERRRSVTLGRPRSWRLERMARGRVTRVVRVAFDPAA